LMAILPINSLKIVSGGTLNQDTISTIVMYQHLFVQNCIWRLFEISKNG
jgi:hypothetical protein